MATDICIPHLKSSTTMLCCTLYYEVCIFLTDILRRLEEVVSDENVATIARDHLTDWESLRPYLGLTRQQQIEIRNSYPSYGKQKHECLEQWKELKGKKATYGELIKAAEKANNQQLADSVRDLLSIELESKEIEEIEGILDPEDQELHNDDSLRVEVNDVRDLGRGMVHFNEHSSFSIVSHT